MMNGNKVFCQWGRSFWETSMKYNTCSGFSFEKSKTKVAFGETTSRTSFESEEPKIEKNFLQETWYQTNYNVNTENIPNKLNDIEKRCLAVKEENNTKTQEFRMQEIEDFILSNAIFRNINGNLCVWNGSYYRQLNLTLFIQEVRKILPKASQNKISRFGRFKEAYEYMLANGELERKFKEKDIDKVKTMIVFKNGIYDAKEKALKAKTHKYPILFEINADYLGEVEPNTPNMDNIINTATNGDQEVLKLFYQSLGYIFSQGTDAKKFFLFATAPDSGKSIIGEFIGRILGDENISTVSLNDFGNRFSLGNIGQKVLNYNMDLPDIELDSNSIQKIKQLTGDQRINCEEKYVQNKTVVHHCKFLFASNHPLRLKYEDEAFYKRLILIPFINSIEDEEKDHQLLEKLWKERHAIATKAAMAYQELYDNNFVFQSSELAQMMIAEWKKSNTWNLYKEFLLQECEMEESAKGHFTPTDLVFKEFEKFCKKNGMMDFNTTKAIFSKEFKKLSGLTMTKKRVPGYNSAVNGYIGLKLKRNWEGDNENE